MDQPATAMMTSSVELPVPARAGANAGILEESDLPMIVWLRGDEPYVSDFSIDAESAMKALGIRRSRLTQISGKELRVGRIRVDRYVRPVYRQSDIDAYLEWTRPTATHIKSSDVLMQAATELRSGSKEITEQILEQLQSWQKELSQNQDAVASETYRIQREGIRQFQEIAETSRQENAERIAGLSSSVLEKISQFDQLTDAIQRQIPATFADFSLKLQDQKAQLISALANALDESLKASRENSMLITELTTNASSIHRSVDETFELAFENFAAVRETLDQQARFHRGVAEALAKIIEVQRELLQLRHQPARGPKAGVAFGRPQSGQRLRRQFGQARVMRRRLAQSAGI